jgi:hypothetical protein
MTDRTDFLVDLEATLQLTLIISPERPCKRPLEPWRRYLFFGRRRQNQRGNSAREGKGEYGAFQN